MGTNATDYIREAHRFDVMAPESEGVYTRIYTLRNAKKPDPGLVLPFRGHVGA